MGAAPLPLDRFVHAAWLDDRAALQTLQPRDLITLCGHNLMQR
jgi:hypothetical protein